MVRRKKPNAPKKKPRWTKEEIKFLLDWYADTSNTEIAEHLGRSVKSVVSKAFHMGLRKSPDRLREMGAENVSIRYS